MSKTTVTDRWHVAGDGNIEWFLTLKIPLVTDERNFVVLKSSGLKRRGY